MIVILLVFIVVEACSNLLLLGFTFLLFSFVICRLFFVLFFFFSSRRRHTRCSRDWSSDVCSSDLTPRSRPFTSSINFGGNDHSRPTTRPTVAFMGLKLRVGGAGDKRDRRLVDCRFHARSPSVAAALARAEGPPRGAPLRPQPRARQPARPLHIRPRRPRPRRQSLPGHLHAGRAKPVRPGAELRRNVGCGRGAFVGEPARPRCDRGWDPEHG